MGRLIIQRIHECDKCGLVPDDGEKMWWMGLEVWCESCCEGE